MEERREELDGAVSRILIDATTPIHFWREFMQLQLAKLGKVTG